jgi:hypothetical protein
VIAFGDASAFDSRTLAEAVGFNDQLAESWLAWLTSREDLIAVGPKSPEQLRLVMTPGQVRRIFWLAAVVMPMGWIMIGLIVWQRRRRP